MSRFALFPAAAGVAAAASVATLVLSANAADASARLPTTAHAVSHLKATDTNFVVGQVTAPLAYQTNMSVVYVELKNTSPYLPLTLDPGDTAGDAGFYASEFNAAGGQIGTLTFNDTGTNATVAPGQEEWVQLKLNVPNVASVKVVNPAGINAPDPGDPLSVSGTATATLDDIGDYELSGTVINTANVTQGAKITILALGAQGQVLDVDRAYSDNTSIAAGGSSTFSEFYQPAPGEPAPTSFAYLANGTASPASFGFSIPLSAPLVYGKSITFSPMLFSGGNELGGASVRLLIRSNGGAPKQIGSGTTNSSGIAKITAVIPPGVNAWFVFDGNASTLGASTGDIYYDVAPSLGLSGPHKAVKPHSKQVFTGSFPGFAGEKAILQELIGKHWEKVNNGGYGSRFVMHVTAPKKPGKYTYRLQVGSSPFHQAATSKVFTLAVK